MATARAMQEALESISKGKVETEIVDLTETISAFLNKTSKRAYEDTTKYAPFLYKLFFDSTDFKTPVRAFNEINYQLNRDKILKLFKDKNPDLIICNSPHWQYIVSLAVEDEAKFTPVISVITDNITLHASWAVGNSNYYIVPNSETADTLQQLNINKDKIFVLGYPISQKFNDKKFNKAALLNKLGLSDDKKTILYLATTAKLSYAKKLIDNINTLLPNAQLIIVTGRDSQLYSKLTKYRSLNETLVNWTDEIAKYILSSDVVITKAGGSTVMECIGANRPVVINKVIPGQEKGNALYISKHHLGLVEENPLDVTLAVQKILNNLNTYKKHLTKNSNPEASIAIAKFIINKLNS